MERYRMTPKTRKRWRTENRIRCGRSSRRRETATASTSSSSWSSLLCMLAAAAIATSSPPTSWVVRGQSTEESSQLRAAAASTDTTMVRGGRGRTGGGRAFVRQHQQQQQQQQQHPNPNQQQHHNELHREEEDLQGYFDPVENEGREETKEDAIRNNHQVNNSELADLLLSKRKNRLEGTQIGNDQQQQQQQQQQYDNFLIWCQDSLGIDVGLVEIDNFDYPNYLRAMEDRIDIFCEDCNDDDEEENGFWADGGDAKEEQGASSGRRSKIESLDDGDRYLSVTEEYPPVSVRGLKASKDISIGEVVLSIPHAALWTIHNAIDSSGDPSLVEAMGAAARKKHGWESPGMDDIPLLAVTLLYHMDKASASASANSSSDMVSGSDTKHITYRPDHGPYLEILEQQTNQLEDTIPHLWSSRKLRRAATPSVRNVAKTIRKDVVELYESIVMVLIEDHPSVFGEIDVHREWMFSLNKFHWAFALVSSRHWHLSIPDDPTSSFSDTDDMVAEPTPPPASSSDNEPEIVPPNDPSTSSDPNNLGVVDLDTGSDDDAAHLDENHESSADQEAPPAATPTDEWVVHQDQKLIEEEEREMNKTEDSVDGNKIQENPSETHLPNESHTQEEPDQARNVEDTYWPPGNSFLAPLADLLNFGPPCTRGIYNHVTMAFEIVATCEFQKGQEITFWYTDACEDVFMANYGFTMPMMVHKCTDGDGIDGGGGTMNHESGRDDAGNSGDSMAWQQRQQEQQQQYLEDELFLAYKELDRLDIKLEFMMGVLDDCHCGNQTELFEKIWNDEDHWNNENNDHGNRHHDDNRDDPDAQPARTANDATAGGPVTKPEVAPFPRSPTPPMKESSHAMQSGNTAAGGTNAVHAIRNRNAGGSLKERNNKTNTNGGGNRAGSDRGSPQQQQPQRPQHRGRNRQHHHSMTRTQSRLHRGRMYDL